MTNPNAAILRAAAKKYSEDFGWKVFPTWGIADGKCECGRAHESPKDMGKHPLGGNGHLDATTDQTVIDAYWPDPAIGHSTFHNIGIPCASNNLLVADVDPRNGGDTSWVRLNDDLGGLPVTLTAMTGRWGSQRGRHYYFVIPDRLAHASFYGKLKDYPGIDFKHQGYVLAAPSAHGSGETYEWEVRGGPFAVAPVEMPEGLQQLLVCGMRRNKSGGGGGGRGDAMTTFGMLDYKGKKIDVDDVLAKGIYEGERINVLYPIMCALANDYPLEKGHGEASFRAVVRGINSKHVFPPLGDEELDFQMQRAIDFVRDNPKDKSIESVLGPQVVDWAVQQAASVNARRTAQGQTAMVDSTSVITTEAEVGAMLSARGESVMAPMPPGAAAGGSGMLPADIDKTDLSTLTEGTLVRFSNTDQGNAARLSWYWLNRVHYSSGMGWYVWDETRKVWNNSPGDLLVIERAQVLPQLIARELAGLAPGDNEFKTKMEWVSNSKSTTKIKHAIEQWKSDTQRVVVPMTSWDANPYYLGVRNGVVDLKTGKLLDSTPEMKITKQTTVAYEPGTRSPRWDQFLDEATGGDKELQRYLQLAAGYTLTGLRKFEVLFLISGPPGTGKSTFLNVLAALLGKYHTTVPTDALVEGPGGTTKGSTEGVLAELHGKRMAEISEWPEGKNTREDVIKMLTGESLTRGRRLYQEAFEFQSTAKLWIGTNVRPRINDRAMWRRIRAIHFGHKPERPDPDLKPFLLDPEGGLPAVLSWAVEGAQLLLGSSKREPLGIDESSHVRAETEEYRRHEDRLGLFLTEEAAPGQGASVPVPELFKHYEMWAEERGEQPMKRISFDRKLRESGLELAGEGKTAVLHGWMMKPRMVQQGPAAGVDWLSAVNSFR